MTRAWLSLALVVAACLPPQQPAPSSAAGGGGGPAVDTTENATALCQYLSSCGLTDDVPSCTAEFVTYDPDRTRSLMDRDCDTLAEMKAGRVPASATAGGGGGACAMNGTNDCGMGQMCCASGGGAAMYGVPGSCVHVAICTGPRR